MLCKYVLAIALVRTYYYCVLLESLCKLVAKVNYNMFQSQPFIECGGAMRPQRKIMMVETTHAFVKLKQIKAAVSVGGIKPFAQKS